MRLTNISRIKSTLLTLSTPLFLFHVHHFLSTPTSSFSSHCFSSSSPSSSSSCQSSSLTCWWSSVCQPGRSPCSPFYLGRCSWVSQAWSPPSPFRTTQPSPRYSSCKLWVPWWLYGMSYIFPEFSILQCNSRCWLFHPVQWVYLQLDVIRCCLSAGLSLQWSGLHLREQGPRVRSAEQVRPRSCLMKMLLVFWPLSLSNTTLFLIVLPSHWCPVKLDRSR